MAKKKTSKSKAPKGAYLSGNSREEFLKFLKNNTGLTRTAAYNKFRESGGSIRKQTALDIARAYADVKKNEKGFIGVTIKKAKTKTAKEIKKGIRTEITIPIFKTDKKPKKNESNILGLDGNYLSKKEATELRKIQRKLREEKGVKLSLKELAQSGTTGFDTTRESYLFAYDTRKALASITATGRKTITIIDRNGKKTTYTGTLDELQNNPEFMMKLEDEQQRLFSGAKKALEERGMEKDYNDKNSEGYKIFQMQVKETQIGKDIHIFDYRDLKEELSGVGAEAIIEGRKKVRN